MEEDLLLPKGVRFCGWLPDGENDAVVLDRDFNLRVWFQARGFKNKDGAIFYDPGRHEIDRSDLPNQPVLDGGPLYGAFEFTVNDSEVNAICRSAQNSEAYVSLGKRILKPLFESSVRLFIDTIRIRYGQYWLRPLHRWDSRSQSLGAYCTDKLNLKWSLDGETWSPFEPNERVQTIHLHGIFAPDEPTYYIAIEDWRDLQTGTWKSLEATSAEEALNRAHESLDQEDQLDRAFIDVVTALELAVSEFTKRAFRNSRILTEKAQTFSDLPLPARIVVLASPLVPTDELEKALKAIEIRNRVVHERYLPRYEDWWFGAAALTICAALLPNGPYVFPTAHGIPEHWSLEEMEQAMKRRREDRPHVVKSRRADIG